jgi:hypothetical protein
MKDSFQADYWGQQIDKLMSEIVRHATICEVKLLDPGVIEAVLANNESVCGHANPAVFKKLREVLMMGMVVRGKVFEKMEPGEAAALVEAVRERIRARVGDKLGSGR